jgi:hypothetical protein
MPKLRVLSGREVVIFSNKTVFKVFGSEEAM